MNPTTLIWFPISTFTLKCFEEIIMDFQQGQEWSVQCIQRRVREECIKNSLDDLKVNEHGQV